MNTEQTLISKWRLLPPEKQQKIIDLVAFLEQNYGNKKTRTENQTIENKNNQLTTNYLESKLIYYKEPYEPVAVEDWEAMR